MTGAPLPRNNFGLIRLLAAWLVLFSHSYHLTGAGAAEPLMLLTGGKMTFGTLAVGVFFSISGYLITASAYARPGLPVFLQARVRRIFPALILVVVLSALVLGAAMSTLAPDRYFARPKVWTYIARNISLLRLQYDLPGVFAATPYGPAVNGSLWTLPIEFALYLAVGGTVWMLRQLRRQDALWLPLLLAAVVCLVCWSLVLRGSQSGAALLVPYFMLGAACRIVRRHLLMHGAIAAVLALVLAVAVYADSSLFPVAASLAISYGTLWIARHERWIAPLDLSRVGDLSYGIYLFAFPLQQTVMALGLAAGPLALCLEASVLTLPAAWLCWHGLEQHFVDAAPASSPLHPELAEGR